MSSFKDAQRIANVFRGRNENVDSSDLLEDVENNCTSNQSIATESENAWRSNISARDWLLNILHSTKYQILIVTLVVFDTLIVITELFIDLELKGRESQVPHMLHSFSIGFLCLFVLEIFVKIYAYKLEFFTLKGEVFDAVVIIVALVLDIISLHSHDALSGSGLVIVLRLWRIVRIQNSIVMSVRRSGEKRLSAEREIRKALEMDLEVMRERNKKLCQYCYDFIKVLQENGIDYKFNYPLLELNAACTS